MTAPRDDLLSRGSRCFLGTVGRHGPEVLPTAFWFDGGAMWMIVAAANLPALGDTRTRDCVAYVPPVDGGEPGVIVHGGARAYSLRDPRGLVLHTATISAAMTALAARNAWAAWGYVREAARAPHRWLARHPLVLRLAVERRTEVDPPDDTSGVAPPLPTVVPADVRRELTGLRRLVVVSVDDAGLHATPAVWDVGYVLHTPSSERPRPGARAVATVDVEDRHPPGWPVGLALHGQIGANDRLIPEQATFWYGFETQAADVARPFPGGVVLPD